MTMSNKLAALTASLFLFPAVSVWAAETVERTLDMPADGLVVVENVAGEIEIEAWDREQAWVRVEPGRQVEGIDIEQTAKGIRVIVRNGNNSRRVDETDVSLKVPSGASLEVRAVSADIEAQGSRGRSVDLESVSGDIRAVAEVDTARLKTVSGDVSFDGLARRISAESVSGDLVLYGIEGEIHAVTVSGDISVEAGMVRRCSLETVSGDAGIELALMDDGRMEVKTMSGDLTLSLPPGQEGQYTAQTYSGDISTDIGKVARSSSGGGALLQHREGANDARIITESFSGDISIRSR